LPAGAILASRFFESCLRKTKEFLECTKHRRRLVQRAQRGKADPCLRQGRGGLRPWLQPLIPLKTMDRNRKRFPVAFSQNMVQSAKTPTDPQTSQDQGRIQPHGALPKK
jgi:hypothetical protein